MIPERLKQMKEHYNCPSLLPGESFQAIAQREGTQAEPSKLGELQIQSWEPEKTTFSVLSWNSQERTAKGKF